MWIVGNSAGSRANNIYSHGSEKFTKVQWYMSTSCQPGSRVISEVEKPFLFSDLVAVSDVEKPFLFSDSAV